MRVSDPPLPVAQLIHIPAIMLITSLSRGFANVWIELYIGGTWGYDPKWEAKMKAEINGDVDSSVTDDPLQESQ